MRERRRTTAPRPGEETGRTTSLHRAIPSPGNRALSRALAAGETVHTGSIGGIPVTPATAGRRDAMIQRDGFDEEVKDWNTKHNGEHEKIGDSEKSTYKELRMAGFGPPQGIKHGKKTEAGEGAVTVGGKGADFVAKRDGYLWIVESKGSGANWTWKEAVDVNTASGPNKPAKQIAHTAGGQQKSLLPFLDQPLSARYESHKLLLAVTNLAATDAMMAIVVRDTKDGSAIIHQHPVTLDLVVRFLLDNGTNAETIMSKIYDIDEDKKTADLLSPQARATIDKLILTADYEIAESELGKALDGVIADWTKKPKDFDSTMLDYLESVYNWARLTNDHPISGENPTATQSLISIAADDRHDGARYRIALQPVERAVPAK